MKCSVLVFLMASHFFYSQAAESKCEAYKKKYSAQMHSILKKSQQCSKDEDCTLLFDGDKQNGCDLGRSLSKKMNSEATFTKLANLKKQVEKQCPEVGGGVCAAMPHTKVFCEDKICSSR